MKKVLIILSIFFLTSAVAPVFAIQSQNTDAVLHYNQGIDDYKAGLYDEALEEFRAAVKLDPNYIDAYYNLGAVLEYMQQYDAALTVFKQIIVRKPDDYDSIYKAAWISYKLGDLDKAKTYLTIIPPSCDRAKEAQALAAQMNFTIPKKQTKPAVAQAKPKPKNKINQTNGIYQNIPSPTGIATDKEGNVYVAEFTTNTILKITPDNKKIVYLKDIKIGGPIGIVFDKIGNLYIANYNKNNILKVSPYGVYTILISNVKKPYSVYIDENMLFVSCQGTSSVLRYKLH